MIDRRLLLPGILLLWALALEVSASSDSRALTPALPASGPQGTPSARTVWDGVYTDEQATRGGAVYKDQCALCHLADLRGDGFAAALIEDSFRLRWQDGNLGDLFTIVKATMPQDRPASLSADDYAAVVAYLLKMNAYPAGPQALGTDAAALKTTMFKKR